MGLLDLIFPPRCGGCGRQGQDFCAACASSLEPVAVTSLRVPVVGGLTRLRPTPAQVGLGQAERQVNVAGAFRWTAPAPPPHGLGLVDDVCTTGATLDAVARVVAEAGGSIGAFLVLAVAQTLPAVAVT